MTVNILRCTSPTNSLRMMYVGTATLQVPIIDDWCNVPTYIFQLYTVVQRPTQNTNIKTKTVVNIPWHVCKNVYVIIKMSADSLFHVVNVEHTKIMIYLSEYAVPVHIFLCQDALRSIGDPGNAN